MNINSEYVRECQACGTTFECNHRNTRYCSSRCRVRYNNLKATRKRERHNLIADRHTETHWKNREVLIEYAGKDVPLSTLKGEGFDYKFVTAWEQQHVDGKLRMIFYVFDCRFLIFSPSGKEWTIRVYGPEAAD